MSKKSQRKLDEALLAAAWEGDAQSLKAALGAGADASRRYDEVGMTALTAAASRGHAECVRLLLPVSDALATDSYALRLAAHHGQDECVAALIPASDPMAGNSHALRTAAQLGHAGCVKLLLPVSDPWAKEEGGRDAASMARWRGHGEIACMIEAFAQAREMEREVANPAGRAPRSL